MNKQDIELLMKDLCGRLPYGVKVQPCGSAFPHKFIGYDKGLVRIDTDQRYELENIKPYLRPMSSMTEEEAIEFVSLYGVEDFLKVNVTQECFEIIIDDELIPVMKLLYEDIHLPVECFDFLLKNHFDFRNLIPMGLALPAPDGMYNF